MTNGHCHMQLGVWGSDSTVSSSPQRGQGRTLMGVQAKPSEALEDLEFYNTKIVFFFKKKTALQRQFSAVILTNEPMIVE